METFYKRNETFKGSTELEHIATQIATQKLPGKLHEDVVYHTILRCNICLIEKLTTATHEGINHINKRSEFVS